MSLLIDILRCAVVNKMLHYIIRSKYCDKIFPKKFDEMSTIKPNDCPYTLVCILSLSLS